MGSRFQRRMTLFPGVALNFSKGGVSLTLGGPGASLNLSSRGATATVGIPGTGLSFRQKLENSSRNQNRPSEAPLETDSPSDIQHFKSASTESVTSEGLEGLKSLILEVESRRAALATEVAGCNNAITRTERELDRARHWLWGIFRRSRIPGLEEQILALESQLADFRDQQAGAYIDLSLNLPPKTKTLFEAATLAFQNVSNCQKIWDVTTAETNDQVATRSAASISCRRQVVLFTTKRPDEKSLFSMNGEVLELGNANGPALQVFPGFILLREGQKLAVISLADVELFFKEVLWIEDEAVPSDATVTGHVWFKTNKNGERDKRFKDNYQIPSVKYGELTLITKEGLNERYMFSNPTLAYKFGVALENVSLSLRKG